MQPFSEGWRGPPRGLISRMSIWFGSRQIESTSFSRSIDPGDYWAFFLLVGGGRRLRERLRGWSRCGGESDWQPLGCRFESYSGSQNFKGLGGILRPLFCSCSSPAVVSSIWVLKYPSFSFFCPQRGVQPLTPIPGNFQRRDQTVGGRLIPTSGCEGYLLLFLTPLSPSTILFNFAIFF